MSQKELNSRYKNIKDTESNWETADPVVLDGELAVVIGTATDSDQVRFKIGNGDIPFSSLPYWEDPSRIPKSDAGVPNGVATLDENGLVPLSQLPDRSVVIIEDIPEQLGVLIYNGQSQMPVWMYYDFDSLIIGGQVNAVDAGVYTAIFQPAMGHVWKDGSQSPVYCNWEIQKKEISVIPFLSSDKFSFNGMLQTPTWLNFNPDELAIGGDTNATAVGQYVATFTPKANYKWADGTAEVKEVAWEIEPCVVSVPTLSGTYVYNGNPQTPTWIDYNPDFMTISGAPSGTNAETYVVTFTLKPGYVWEDGSSNPVEVEWAIEPKVIETVPSVTGELTYNGASQSPVWLGYTSEALIMSGDIVGTDAGQYATVFTPNPNYIWSEQILNSLAI